MPLFPADTTPNYGIKKIPMFNTEVISYGGGTEQRIKRWPNARHRFKIQFNIIIKEEADRLYAFYVDMGGAFQSFEWTNPEDGLTYRLRFEQDSLDHEAFSYLVFNVGELALIEVDA